MRWLTEFFAYGVHSMKVTIYRDVKGEYRWTLTAGNGRKIADCGEGYKRRRDCEKQAKKLFPAANFV